MERTIAAFEARRQFGKLLQEVLTSGDRFVVKRHGEPVAAVVPIAVYEQWKQARSAFFAKVRAASERANLAPHEAQRVASDAVLAVRTTSQP